MEACAWKGVVYVALNRVSPPAPAPSSTSPLAVMTRSVAGSWRSDSCSVSIAGRAGPSLQVDAQVTRGADRHFLALRHHGDEVAQPHDTRAADGAVVQRPAASRRGAAGARAARAACRAAAGPGRRGLAGELRGQIQPGRGGPDEVVVLWSLERGGVGDVAVEASARHQSGVADARACLVAQRDHAIRTVSVIRRGVQLGAAISSSAARAVAAARRRIMPPVSIVLLPAV